MSALARLTCGAQKTKDDSIEVDVAIVGGGASGAYLAVRLREDYEKQIVVIEKTDRLGGHVHSYQPPDGGDPINYGVQAYLNRPRTADFFERFNVSLVDPELSDGIDLFLRTKNVDFQSGQSVDVDYGPFDLAGVPEALLRYLGFAIKYQPWFEDGYFQQGEVPEDLLLPFGDFLDKYNLGGALGVLRNLLWLSEPLKTSTWHVMAVVGQPQIAAFGLDLTGPSFKYPGTHSSETLFDRVLDLLADDVLLKSTVAASKRTDTGVSLTVQTPSGQKSVRAKKLLIAATPSPDNIGSWDLDDNESTLFGKFSWETLYVGVINGTGLPNDVTGIRNTPDDEKDFFLPQGNFVDAYDRSGDRDIWQTRVIGGRALSLDEARAMLLSPLHTMGESGLYPIGEPSIAAFASHGLTVPKLTPDDLKDGFYNKLYSLQGQRSTFWTGLTWAPDYTPIIWDFNEKLLPQIVEGL
ncbi:hypothetical protein B0I35DRAFT_360007 [Stachybotrys elegans]|uniref:Amine oxidase domain-containing protein n=1 Tax=Stachybotrys elegans TaxID=80388 RepID=A0A8K0WMB5_9HYPO|nr:hypothetical protein B0I35DRAFT_360007 [Stachybotrys elegans]